MKTNVIYLLVFVLIIGFCSRLCAQSNRDAKLLIGTWKGSLVGQMGEEAGGGLIYRFIFKSNGTYDLVVSWIGGNVVKSNRRYWFNGVKLIMENTTIVTYSVYSGIGETEYGLQEITNRNFTPDGKMLYMNFDRIGLGFKLNRVQADTKSVQANNSQQFRGTWDGYLSVPKSDGLLPFSYTFSSDGTYELFIMDQKKTGRWEVVGSYLIFVNAYGVDMSNVRQFRLVEMGKLIFRYEFLRNDNALTLHMVNMVGKDLNHKIHMSNRTPRSTPPSDRRIIGIWQDDQDGCDCGFVGCTGCEPCKITFNSDGTGFDECASKGETLDFIYTVDGSKLDGIYPCCSDIGMGGTVSFSSDNNILIIGFTMRVRGAGGIEERISKTEYRRIK